MNIDLRKEGTALLFFLSLAGGGEAAFWQYYRDDARHTFMPPGKATSRAVDTPPWAGR